MNSDGWAVQPGTRMTRPSKPRSGRDEARGPAPVLGLLAAMWIVFACEVFVPGDWVSHGLVARDPHAWYGVVTAPLLHASLSHIVGNSAPMLVLGILVCMHGHRAFWQVIAWSAVLGAGVAWVLTPAGTVIVGASGLVFGLFAYLVVRAVVPGTGSWRRRVVDVVVAAGVVSLYGGVMVAGILNAGPSVSWQMHLGGALGGALAAVTGAGDEHPR
ncbi:MAG: rhomboid family intramembrane serine protease [Propionibacterium sp.]|nr:rhomboid family intramembrane serine protease [Propionibacterium sp.]